MRHSSVVGVSPAKSVSAPPDWGTRLRVTVAEQARFTAGARPATRRLVPATPQPGRRGNTARSSNSSMVGRKTEHLIATWRTAETFATARSPLPPRRGSTRNACHRICALPPTRRQPPAASGGCRWAAEPALAGRRRHRASCRRSTGKPRAGPLPPGRSRAAPLLSPSVVTTRRPPAGGLLNQARTAVVAGSLNESPGLWPIR